MSQDPTRDEPVRIDVELVEHGVADRNPPDERDGFPAGATPAAGGGRNSAMRLSVAVGAATAVLAAVIGVAIGRATGGDQAAGAAEATPASTATTIAPSDPVDDTIAPVAPPAEPEDDSDRGRILAADGSEITEWGTLESPVVSRSIGIDERLSGIDQQLVAPRRDGTWVRLDLADGTFEEFAVRRPASLAFRDGALVAGDGWFTYLPQQGSGDVLVWRDSSSSWEITSLGASFQILREAGADRFWVAVDGPDDSGATLELVDLDGEPVGERIEVPIGSFVTAGDPRGGVIVWGGGRLFQVEPDERTPIGVGQLIAANEGTLVVWSCDDSFECGVEVTDRASGDRRRVAVADESGGDRLLAGSSFGAGDLARPLSPNGEALATTTFTATSSELVVLDLVSGALRVIDGASGPFPQVWTPDSRYLIYVDGGVPLAFDRQTGETFTVSAHGELASWIDLVAVT